MARQGGHGAPRGFAFEKEKLAPFEGDGRAVESAGIQEGSEDGR